MDPKITVSICGDSPEELASLIKGLARSFGASVPVTQEDIKNETKKPVAQKPAPKLAKVVDEPEESSITTEQIRDRVSEVIELDEANKNKIKKILTKMGAGNVSTLSTDKYVDFMASLNELAEEI